MPQVIVIIHLMPVFEVVQKRFSVFEGHIYHLSISCDGSSRHTFVATRLQCTVSGHKLHYIILFFHTEEHKDLIVKLTGVEDHHTNLRIRKPLVEGCHHL